MSNENTTVDTNALKAALEAYESLLSQVSEHETAIAELRAEMATQVKAIAAIQPTAFNYVRGGETLTITPVVSGGKARNASFLRGFSPRVSKAAKPRLTV